MAKNDDDLGLGALALFQLSSQDSVPQYNSKISFTLFRLLVQKKALSTRRVCCSAQKSLETFERKGY